MRIAVDIGPLRPPFTGIANFELFLLDALIYDEPTLPIEGFGKLSWTPINRLFLQETAERALKMLQGVADGPTNFGRKDDRQPFLLKMWQSARALDGVQRLLLATRRIGFEVGSDPRRFDLFHAFAYCPPGRVSIPVVPVVYDLSYLRFPDTHPTARLRAMEALAHYIPAAPAVHTISEFTASEIAELFGIERSRIVVTYPGVAPIFHTKRGPCAETLRRFDLMSGTYALTVATLEPRKNLRTLIAAFSRLPTAVRVQMPLCVVGGMGWGDIALPAQSLKLEREGSLRFLGYTSDAQLRDLYAGARVMVYPSLYEGFGMPVIEAMACGAPVIASKTSSLPEAVGDSGRLVHPLDVDAWTDELLRVAADLDYRSDLAVATRRAHALSFTWRRAANDTIQMYRRVTGVATQPAA